MLIHLAAFVVVVAGIMAAKSILMPFLLASFLAIICAPPLYWLRSKGVPPHIALLPGSNGEAETVGRQQNK